MDAQAIIAMIEKRRDRFRDAASGEPELTRSSLRLPKVAWAIAEEYDSLLAEIESTRAE